MIKIFKTITWPLFRRYLITGILTLLPLVTTIYVLWTLFKLVDSILGGIIYSIINTKIPGLGLLAFLVLAFIIGLAVTNVVGRYIFGWTESIIKRLPLINAVYSTVKQISDSIFSDRDGRRTAFRRVVLVPYPRAGVYSIGFVTGEGIDDIRDMPSKDMVKVFIASTPNPTSGFFIFVPRHEVIDTDYSVEEGMRLVISGGMAKLSKKTKKT